MNTSRFESAIVEEKYPDTSNVLDKDTSFVASNKNQSLTIPLNYINLLSSSSNDSDLTNGTFFSPIYNKDDNDKEIIKKIEEAMKSMFQVGQVFQNAQECKRWFCCVNQWSFSCLQ